MSKVSIVIPAYNADRYIREAIDSALYQTYSDREVIVVDDGSTDETARILANYGDKIRVIRQANQGTAAACNTAAIAAQGSWVAFLDADDVWFPEKLSKQLAMCAKFVISHTDSVCFGAALPDEIRRSSFTNLYEGSVLPQLLVSNFIIKSSVLMSRQAFISAGGFPKCHEAVEDWPLWLKVCAKGDLGYVAEALVKYRVHPASKSMKARATCAAHVAIISEAFGIGGVGEFHQNLRRRALAASFGINSHYAATSEDWPFAIRCALNALRFEPFALGVWKTLIKSMLIPLGKTY